MNRRLPIFVFVFIIVCVAGLGYTYSIVPTYVATAMIQVDPGTNPDDVQKGAAFVANEAQALNSNEMLENVLATLGRTHRTSDNVGTVVRLREVLSAAPSSGSNVIQLQARGSEPAQLAALLETWAATYLASRGTRRTVDRGASLEEARAAVASIESRVTQKRRELDEFRRRNNIISSERDENEVTTQMKSLTGSVNDARNKAIAAESLLSSVKTGVAEGAPVYRPQDKTEIAQLEQRLLGSRQALRDLELKFTPHYVANEPGVQAMRANMKQLEQQLEDAKRKGQQAMLNEATRDLATAQKNVERIEAQFGERRKDALSFTSRFAEHKAQTAALAQLETQLGQAQQRSGQLERSEPTREPKYELLGRPTVPEKPVHPDYLRYSGYSVGGAILAALLAVLLVEFLNPRPKPRAPEYPQPIIQIAYPTLVGGTSGEPLRLSGAYPALADASNARPGMLPAPLRELGIAEVQALWRAATRDGRFAIAALFSGLTLAQLAALRWNDVDLQAGSLKLPDSMQPGHLLTPPFDQELQGRVPGQSGTGAVATTSSGSTLSVADLAGLVAAAAHDAGIEQAWNVDEDVLRHTYLSYLVRQGVRLSELEQIAGPVAPASFLNYRNLSPRNPGVSLDTVNRVFPAFLSGRDAYLHAGGVRQPQQ